MVAINKVEGPEPMAPRENGSKAEIPRVTAQKEWRTPGLRRLPIAATAQGKLRPFGDDGGCVGKGDSALCVS